MNNNEIFFLAFTVKNVQNLFISSTTNPQVWHFSEKKNKTPRFEKYVSDRSKIIFSQKFL